MLGCARPGRCPVQCPGRCPPPAPGHLRPRIVPMQVGGSPATSSEGARPRPALLGRPVSTSSTPFTQPQVPRVFEEVTPLPTTSPGVGRLSQPKSGLRTKHTHNLRFMLRGDSWAGAGSCLRTGQPTDVAPRSSLRTPGLWTAPVPSGHCRRDSLREPPLGPGHRVYPLSPHLRGWEGHINLYTEEFTGGNNRPLRPLGLVLGDSLKFGAPFKEPRGALRREPSRRHTQDGVGLGKRGVTWRSDHAHNPKTTGYTLFIVTALDCRTKKPAV